MPRYYMLHKPRGCITARRDPRHKTVMDLFPEEDRDVLFPVGRLDRDTEGLLVVTDDGGLNFKLLSPKTNVEKSYFFWSQGIPDDDRLRDLEVGANVFTNRSELTKPARIKLIERSTMRGIRHLLDDSDASLANRRGDLPTVSGIITITEGKKHQVKRMIRYAGGKVVYLKRFSMGGLHLDGGLPPGSFRPLTDDEIATLRSAVE